MTSGYTAHFQVSLVLEVFQTYSMLNTFDLIILGGGCAGLSLAARLASASLPGCRTLVVESRTHYTNDRSWCFWVDEQSNGAYTVERQWSRMRLTSGVQTTLVDCGLTPYQMLTAENFYGAVLSVISQAQNITLKVGTAVLTTPIKIDGSWRVSTDAGVFSGRMVVDTRPQQLPERDGALLWQSFYGQEIECDTPVFDATCMDLMNFLPADPICIPFVYVLPMRPTRALVEVTVFGVQPLVPEDLAFKLETAIAQRVGGASFRVLRSEHGILPMGLPARPKNADCSYVRVGLMAGGARPSTGYAFQRIQRWADACTKSLLAGFFPIEHTPDPAVLQAMDKLFLKVIRANPEQAGALFCALFAKADPSRVIRFLSGEGTWLDYAAVVAALPPWPFIKSMFDRREARVSHPAAGQNA